MSKFSSPPTYAEPFIESPDHGLPKFNPIWIKWFIELSRNLTTAGAGSGGGSVTSVGLTENSNLLVVSGSPVTGASTITLSVVGNAGGIPYFDTVATWTSTGALVNNSVVLGGGTAGPKIVTQSNDPTKYLRDTNAGAPVWDIPVAVAG